MFEAVLPLVTVVWHTAVIYAFLIFCLSRFGRRQVAQITSIELVVIMILGSAVETAMVAGDTSLPAGLVSATVLLVANRLLTRLLRRSKRLRHFVLGGPVILVHDGRVVPAGLHRVGLTEADVLAAIRERGYGDLADVRLAVLEIDGSVGVVPIDAPMHRGRSLRTVQGPAAPS
jgi:uncharacterized membrane protein YcaP (DUF421 family)